MKEDSEKVPTLLTDYILKGKHKKFECSYKVIVEEKNQLIIRFP